MIKKILSLCFILVIAITTYVFYNSQKTFEANFKNVDGLPKGAPVTALGVKIGEVVRAKPIKDGIKVTVRITNKSFPRPEAGSQLTITSFRPGQGRVLEIIPSDEKLTETKAWIIQEPITAESWLHASLDILDGLENFSKLAIKHVTPENFNKARVVLKDTSDTLSNTASHLSKYEGTLVSLEKNISSRSSEGEKLLKKLQNSIGHIAGDSKIVENKETIKADFSTFSDKLSSVSDDFKNPNLVNNLKDYKANFQEYLTDVNESLIGESEKIADSKFKSNYKDFNKSITGVNSALGKINLNEEKRNSIKAAISKLRESTTRAAEATQN